MDFIAERGLISFLVEISNAVLQFGGNIWNVLMYHINIGIYEGPLIGMILGSSFVTIFISWIVITVIDILA